MIQRSLKMFYKQDTLIDTLLIIQLGFNSHLVRVVDDIYLINELCKIKRLVHRFDLYLVRVSHINLSDKFLFI